MSLVRALPRCGWCGFESVTWWDVAEHADHDCVEAKRARREVDAFAARLRYAADILDRRVRPRDEEPFVAVLREIARTEEGIRTLMEYRDRHLNADARPSATG